MREHASYDRLSREAAEPYRYIWKSWCDWLGEQRDSADPYLYAAAGAQEMYRYLRVGPSPASKRKSKSAPTSPITRQRYGRVLKEIYQHGVNFGFCTSNPVSDAAIGEAPTTSERSAQVLPPTVFSCIPQVFPNDPTPYEKRDIAILLLLMDTAMTSGELRDLELKNIDKDLKDPGQFILRIDGPRTAQRREISTRGPTGPALHKWLVYRNVMRRSTDVVFVSEKRGAMQRETLFRLVAKYVSWACARANVAVPNHIGPGTIRNTAIVRWLNSGESPATICLRTGIKDERTLLFRLKMHLAPSALASSSES